MCSSRYYVVWIKQLFYVKRVLIMAARLGIDVLSWISVGGEEGEPIPTHLGSKGKKEISPYSGRASYAATAIFGMCLSSGGSDSSC